MVRPYARISAMITGFCCLVLLADDVQACKCCKLPATCSSACCPATVHFVAERKPTCWCCDHDNGKWVECVPPNCDVTTSGGTPSADCSASHHFLTSRKNQCSSCNQCKTSHGKHLMFPMVCDKRTCKLRLALPWEINCDTERYRLCWLGTHCTPPCCSKP